jgi:hypothetical protein
MCRFSLTLSVLALAALAVAQTSLSSADPVPAKKAETAPAKPTEDWKEDPVCRMVFFAVLEGLYSDGVSTEAVDRVVGRKAKGGAPEIKQTFVIQCPLCHPVYEAFCLYQQRSTFNGDKRDTFGKGLDTQLERLLQSENLVTRQRALEVLVQDWVGRRLGLMRLSESERRDWAQRLEERSKQGKDRLKELRLKDSWYKAWSGYAGCPSCDGTTAACKAVKAAAKKE